MIQQGSTAKLLRQVPQHLLQTLKPPAVETYLKPWLLANVISASLRLWDATVINASFYLSVKFFDL